MSATSKAPIASEPGSKIDESDAMKSEDAPANAVSVAPMKKEPPPESPESIRLRSYVILSFWVIIIIVGLPIWWKTTTIYRARLPLDQMMDWADGRVHSLCIISGGSKLTSAGLSTGISPSNIDRSRFSTRSRSTTSSANDPACAGRLERLLGASFAFTALSLQCINGRDRTFHWRCGERRIGAGDKALAWCNNEGGSAIIFSHTRHLLHPKPSPVELLVILLAGQLYREYAKKHVCRRASNDSIPTIHKLRTT
jgi:hypothetical protein